MLSYNPEDPIYALIAQSKEDQAFTTWDALTTENNTTNWLGFMGALVANGLISNFLGRPSIVVPILSFFWGWLFVRRHPSLYLPIYTVYGLLGAFEFACLFGWSSLTFNVNLTQWSGALGLMVADFLTKALGAVGSLIAILMSMLITLILLVDRDLDDTIARIEEATGALWELLVSMGRFLVEYIRTSMRMIKDKRSGGDDLSTLPAYAETGFALEEPGPPPPRPPSDDREEDENYDDDALDLLTYRNKVAKGDGAHGEATAAPPREQPEEIDAFPLPPEGPRLNDFLRQQMSQKSGDDATGGPSPIAPLPSSTRPGSRPGQSVGLDVNTRTTPSGQLELTVQRPIQEERADKIANTAANVQLAEHRYRYPSVELLDKSNSEISIDYAELEENKQILLDKLATYNIEISNINAIVGPTITLYELTPAPGIKISKIKALEDDLAMAMAARGIRMVAPIPGKSAIGVEIPNRHREVVRLRDLIATKRFRDNKMRLPLPLGKTIEGQVSIHDITTMPHLLIAGATGSGKSVCLNALITSLLYACHPSNLRFVMIDPKKIELQQYSRIVDHYLAMPPESESPIITDVSQALGVLRSCEREMDFRYNLLQKAMVRSLHEYNLKFRNGDLSPEEGHRHFPYLVVVVDELADLMLTAGKEIEGPIARLAQMARAVGIHLVLATQRPSVDVITGLIKANFPARVAFQVASKVDSRTILDQNGAEGLVGNGDMLYMKGSQVTRLQGPFVSVDEVDCISEFIAEQPGPGPYYLPSIEDTPQLTVESSNSNDRDELFEEAARIIVESQQGSVSLLQRKLSIGYTRSARIVDQLENAGIVGPFEGSKARQVLVSDELTLREVLDEL